MVSTACEEAESADLPPASNVCVQLGLYLFALSPVTLIISTEVGEALQNAYQHLHTIQFSWFLSSSVKMRSEDEGTRL